MKQELFFGEQCHLANFDGPIVYYRIVRDQQSGTALQKVRKIIYLRNFFIRKNLALELDDKKWILE